MDLGLKDQVNLTIDPYDLLQIMQAPLKTDEGVVDISNYSNYE